MKLTQSLSPQDALIGFSENDHCLRKQNGDLMLNWLDALPIVRVYNRKRRHRKERKAELATFSLSSGFTWRSGSTEVIKDCWMLSQQEVSEIKWTEAGLIHRQ